MIAAAEWAIAKRTLLNPEFGLIILAGLVERFPTRSTPKDALASLTEMVAHDHRTTLSGKSPSCSEPGSTLKEDH